MALWATLKAYTCNCMTPELPSDEWIAECMRYWGRTLTGRYCHWCPDWDYLPIDNTCELEFECCTCPKDEANDASRPQDE